MNENILDLTENNVDRFGKSFWTTIIPYRFSKAFWPDCLETDWGSPCGLIVYEQNEQMLVGRFFMNRLSKRLWADCLWTDWANLCWMIVYEQIEQKLLGWPDCLWTYWANACAPIVCKPLWIKRKLKTTWKWTSLQMLK